MTNRVTIAGRADAHDERDRERAPHRVDERLVRLLLDVTALLATDAVVEVDDVARKPNVSASAATTTPTTTIAYDTNSRTSRRRRRFIGSGEELVAHAANGADELGRVGAVTERAADAPDVHVDDALVAEEVPAPDLLEQLGSREHAPGSASQRDEQVELERARGSTGAPSRATSWRVDVDDQAVELEPFARRPRRPVPRPRRSTARVRATSSRGLNGLVT